jgi:hypothetical protein
MRSLTSGVAQTVSPCDHAHFIINGANITVKELSRVLKHKYNVLALTLAKVL